MVKNLPDVTLLAISSDRVQSNIDALVRCMGLMNFGAVKFLSHVKPDNLPDGIQFEESMHLKSIKDFDYYAFRCLGKHVQTSHCLMVQDHAFILHPEIWKDDWLQFDFCGALWPERPEFISQSTGTLVRLGNGGFSLRSKRIMDLPEKLDLPVVEDRGFSNDDGLLNSLYRKVLLENGVVYPEAIDIPEFSYENDTPENINITKFFGFHRYMCERME